ncbi:hypothetical protein AHAS_Ahas03G0093400 [Arachis hypogaea]
MSAEKKEKCYVWATRVKTYRDGSTNEYDLVCTLKAQDRFILTKVHFVSLKAATHIEAEGYVISRMRVYAGGSFLRKKDREIEPPYISISGQKTSYDCAIYEEVDHFKVEFASWILFHEMNQDRNEAIRENETVRLSKPSSLLLSPYCQIDSYDIESD